jgi:hypothetical protein
MKVLLYVTALLLLAINQATSFVSPARQHAMTKSASSTTLSFGLLDFFSEEAKQKREEAKRRAIEEQELLQQQILERRKNPEQMEEYEARVAVRRKLYMAGREDIAADFKVMKEVESEED